MKSHKTDIRVRYEETDQMGVVYYSKYLVWFEIGRTEFFRARGIEYKEIEQREKIFLPVREVFCRYRAPLRYDDIAEVQTSIKEITSTRLDFEYEIRKDGKMAATGYTGHVFVDRSGKPVRIPETLAEILTGGNS